MEQVLRDGERSDYRVHVFTGNKLGASTRADIRLVMYGDKGRTQEIFLSDSRNHKIKFQKGQVRHCVFFRKLAFVSHHRKFSVQFLLMWSHDQGTFACPFWDVTLVM